MIIDCNIIFIVFDLNNRNSFDNLNDYWLSFINESGFCEDLYILGNYFKTESAPLTQSEEIKEMIKFSRVNASYIEIGDKTNEEVILMIDDIILSNYENEIKKSKNGDDCKAGSFKFDKCVIY
jgi:hypothetical protein